MKLFYQGHGSFRLELSDGRIIYVDPYAGKDDENIKASYGLPADIILVTHQHHDHNQVDLCAKKDGCKIISNFEALSVPEKEEEKDRESDGGGEKDDWAAYAAIPGLSFLSVLSEYSGIGYNKFDVGGIIIQAVEASNKNHSPEECAGYVITADGIKIYAAGDTSATQQMRLLKNIDYALLPCDGKYNMDAKEAAECARLIKARHNIPYHTGGGLFDRAAAEAFDAPNRLIIDAGQEIQLQGRIMSDRR